jgi:hypothetical protein
MAGMQRPTDNPEIREPYPYLDDLAGHLAKLDADSPVSAAFQVVRFW